MAARHSAVPDERGSPPRKGTGLESHSGQVRESGPLELDRIIHERVRLGIVSALAADGPLTFTHLKELLGTTDGNLSAHARRLEEAGYIACEKSFEDRMPKTEYTLTRVGRRELENYLDHMEAIIRSTRDR